MVLALTIINVVLERESHNLWLGSILTAQPTLTPESRQLFYPNKSHTE
jgi:hypothetical protein